MSVSYWGIVGYGICIDKIIPHLNNEKIKSKIKELFAPKDTESIDDAEDVFDEDWFYGDPYSNFAEFLCEFDDKHILTWDDDGNGRAFFLYTPCYPWKFKPEELNLTVDDINMYMTDIIKLVCDLPDEDISNMIDYINDWGCG